ncbi:RHS repeat domain-containing protein, partial [Acinetobacter baumannii]
YNYDAANRLIGVVDALNKTESYTYDAVGNRKTVTDRTGAVTTYNYDAANRLIGVVDALNKTESYTYDA